MYYTRTNIFCCPPSTSNQNSGFSLNVGARTGDKEAASPSFFAFLLAVTSGQGETSVPSKFHKHPDHVLVRQKSQQLVGEATVPDSVISSCQIDKHGTSLFCLKKILNVLRKQNDLIYGRLFVPKSSLFLWKQRADYWFDTIVDQSFEDLVRNIEQRDGMVAL